MDRTSFPSKETFSSTTHLLKKFHHYTFLKIKGVTKESLDSIKTKFILLIHCHNVDIFSNSHKVRRNSHNEVQLNPSEDKYYLLTSYPTLMPSLKKISLESIRAIARNPNFDLQLVGNIFRSEIHNHIRTQQFQELLTQMDSIQRQAINQNLRQLAESFSGFYPEVYSG